MCCSGDKYFIADKIFIVMIFTTRILGDEVDAAVEQEGTGVCQEPFRILLRSELRAMPRKAAALDLFPSNLSSTALITVASTA